MWIFLIEADEAEQELAETPTPEAAAANPAVLTKTHWTTQATKDALKPEVAFQQQPAPTALRTRCATCLYTGTRKRLLYHVRQHICQYYCPCRYASQARDSVWKHQQLEKIGCGALIYEVDADSYEEFVKKIGQSSCPMTPRWTAPY